MKKLLLLVFFSATFYCVCNAQPEQEAKQLYESAKTFMRQGDYDNALMVIKKAIEKDAQNLDMQKDLCFIYFLKREYGKAIEVGKPLTDRPDADEQTFQILGMTYKALAEYKECKKLYKKALLKFPNSGVIYNEFGELLGMDNDLNNAITYWEKGIEVDANNSNNYYNAVNFYAKQSNPDLFWIILHGENFVNLESYTARTVEVKKLILSAYKKLYATNAITAENKKANNFQKDVLATLSKTTNMANEGITAESLMAIRTRFVLDWFEGNNKKYNYKLFDNFQHMLKEGIFNAYNQWLFAMVDNADAYTLWVKNHEKEAEAFKKFQTARIYKIPAGQYYK